jgi:hypothetical protein
MPPFQKKEKVVDSSEPVAVPEPVSARDIDMTLESETLPTVRLTLADLKELLGGHANGITPEVLAAIMTKTAETTAEAMRKSLKPENPHAPEVSVFSYPEGERARPKPQLPFELLWSGFPVHKESSVVTWWEMEQYAQLKPGEYICSRQDLSPIKVTVAATYAADGQTISRLTVSFPADRDLRVTMPSPFVWAYQMNHADRAPRETYVEAMSKLLQIQLQDKKSKDAALAVAS